MALARTRAVALVGVTGHLVEVEADISPGVPSYALVGLPDTSLAESRDRVRAAIVNSGQRWPSTTRRTTVNLSPASLPKRGSSFDLAIALAVLAADGVVPPTVGSDAVLLGELGLDGRVRAVRGVLPAVLAAAGAGLTSVVVPAANAAEAALVPDMRVTGVRSLRQLVALARGDAVPLELGEPDDEEAAELADGDDADRLDLADVLGQPGARAVLEVAAAGGHHLLMVGPPGAGKTMLAERLPGLLPPLDTDAAIDVTAVHSVAGTLPPGSPLMTRPPFQSPHHTASVPAIVGGGSSHVRPGAASLAHRGVLFMDEAPQFSPAVLDALREPLESGQICVSRLAAQVRFPARFQLVLAANPCPCGQAVGKGRDCRCAPMAKLRYFGRLSGPLLDRVDLRHHLSAPTRRELRADQGQAESSAVVAERVLSARERMTTRLRDTPWRANSEVPGYVLRRDWPLPWDVVAVAEQELDKGALTARGVDRVLRVAWTIADLSGLDRPRGDEVAVALTYRGVEQRAA
ncbi:MAG: YifB family Mg chelatase-like AAA ATPase [Actinomycetes bacterium]